MLTSSMESSQFNMTSMIHANIILIEMKINQTSFELNHKWPLYLQTQKKVKVPRGLTQSNNNRFGLKSTIKIAAPLKVSQAAANLTKLPLQKSTQVISRYGILFLLTLQANRSFILILKLKATIENMLKLIRKTVLIDLVMDSLHNLLQSSSVLKTLTR